MQVAVDVERSIEAASNGGMLASALARDAPRLRVDDSLEQVVQALGATDDEGLPVLTANGTEVVGRLTHRGLLSAYRLRVAAHRYEISRSAESVRKPT